MTYKVNILQNANEDLNWFRRHDKTSYIKAFDLTREIMVNEELKEVDITSYRGHY